MSHWIPKYCHFKARNLAYVRLNGRQYYLGRFGSLESRQAYDDLIARWLPTRRLPEETSRPGEEFNEPAGLSLNDWAAAFQDFAVEYYGNRSPRCHARLPQGDAVGLRGLWRHARRELLARATAGRARQDASFSVRTTLAMGNEFDNLFGNVASLPYSLSIDSALYLGLAWGELALQREQLPAPGGIGAITKYYSDKNVDLHWYPRRNDVSSMHWTGPLILKYTPPLYLFEVWNSDRTTHYSFSAQANVHSYPNAPLTAFLFSIVQWGTASLVMNLPTGLPQGSWTVFRGRGVTR